jgi:hypothetical protein
MDRPPPWTVPAPLEAARAQLEQGFARFRHGTRGLLLPLLLWPLFFDAVWEIATADARALSGNLLGVGFTLFGVHLLRRGRRGDTRRAAVMVAVATGMIAGLGATLPMPMPVLLAAGAWLGTRLLYDGAVAEVAPPAPPPPPGPLDAARARLARIALEPRLAGVAAAMGGVLDDLATRPERLSEARRFLTVNLDGLDRIRERLEAGAAPPPGLPRLLDELTAAAGELRTRLREQETVALDIQVKVLSERLRQEGYA